MDRDPSNRERRAIDGLDWSRQEEREEAAIAPVQTPPVAVLPVGSRRWPIVMLVALAAVGGGLVSGVSVAFLAGGNDGVKPVAAPAVGSTLQIEQTSAVSDVASRARPGVVLIASTRRTSGGLEQDVGSGVILDAQGHVLTNAHVVLGTDSLRVYLSDGTERPAILLGHDFPFTDIAVLQISPGKLTPIQIGDSSAVKLGQAVVAVGNPLAEFDGSISVGVISGIGRQRTFDGVRQTDLLQTDAAINHGNSGGALLNLQGQLIGIPTAILRQSRSGQAVEGIAFALPSNRAMEVANKIMASGANYPRPSLGAEHLDLSTDVLQRLPRLTVTEGALIASVTPSGPADAAGIQAGDVITKFGDLAVTRDAPFLNALMAHDAGQMVRVVLNRNGRIIEAEVRLVRRS